MFFAVTTLHGVWSILTCLPLWLCNYSNFEDIIFLCVLWLFVLPKMTFFAYLYYGKFLVKSSEFTHQQPLPRDAPVLPPVWQIILKTYPFLLCPKCVFMANLHLSYAPNCKLLTSYIIPTYGVIFGI